MVAAAGLPLLDWLQLATRPLHAASPIHFGHLQSVQDVC